jgi:hypothetical protein
MQREGLDQGTGCGDASTVRVAELEQQAETLRSRVAAAEACLVQAQVCMCVCACVCVSGVHPYTALCTTLQYCLWRGRLAAQVSVSL